MAEEHVTRREFEDFRHEQRKHNEKMETRLWQMGALFVAGSVGLVIAQLTRLGDTPPAAAAALVEFGRWLAALVS